MLARNDGVWPMVLVGWRSKGDELLEAIRKGQVDIWTGKLHVRKGARFLALLEDGTVLALGEVSGVRGNLHDLSLDAVVCDVNADIALPADLVDKVRAVPRSYLKGPLSAFILPPDKEDGVFTMSWFNQATDFVRRSLRSGTDGSGGSRQILPQPTANPAADNNEPSDTPEQNERESLLKSWIPPLLQGLLADHVRSDKWELLVAYGFRALGCQVNMQGQKESGKAVPDCVVRHTSAAGQVIQLVVDAKAGHWNGAVDDIRAMRDYLDVSTPYSYPLFVANIVGPDVQEKLRQHLMHGKTARAISGHDLALLIMQRLTDPSFDVGSELRRIFL